jgi:hypothetical protein
MTVTTQTGAAIEPTTILILPPAAVLRASGAKPPILFSFYEGEIADSMTIAPISELIIGSHAVVVWSFEGCDPGSLSFSATAEKAGFATVSTIQPEVGGAIATVEISGGEVVGPVQLTFIPR